MGTYELPTNRMKSLLRGVFGSPSAGTPSKPGDSIRSLFSSRHAATAMVTRSSRGLQEFFNYIRGQSGLTILDFGAATQQNVSFITNLGHRLYSENFLQLLKESFASDPEQANPGAIDHFLKHALDYPEGQFDGVLIWDVLEYLSPPLLTAVVERLHKIVRPNSYMLAFFHSDDKQEAVPFYTFRIQDPTTLQVEQGGSHQPLQLFNNRRLEKLFAQFASVKFFLTRERLREVIVKV